VILCQLPQSAYRRKKNEYIERHKETLNLLSNPKWVEVIKKGKKEVAEEVKGKTLDELED
jgi:hypothetical protein